MKRLNNEKIFYLFIAIWPLIFCVNEMLKFPTVLLSLIITIISFAYLLKLNAKKAKVLFISIMGLYLIQCLLMLLNYKFDITIKDFSELAKFGIRWSNFIVYLATMAELDVLKGLRSYIENRKTIIFYSACCVLGIQIISLFFNQAYDFVWGGKYFKSIMYSPHVNSYFLIVLMAVFIMIYTYQSYKIISILGAVSALTLNLLTGARTTGVLGGVIFAIFLISLLIKNGIKLKIIFVSFIALFSIIIVLNFFKIIDITDIPLVEKFITVLEDPSGFLNGRNYIWGNMYRYTMNHFNILNWFFGAGLAQSMQINDFYIGQALWAHNDFIETFIGCGLIGLTIYVRTLYKYVINTKEYIIFLIMLVVMFFNGLFLYTELLIGMPILTLVGLEIKKNLKSR